MIDTKKFDLLTVTALELAPLQILLPNGWIESWKELVTCLYVALLRCEGFDLPREALAKVAIGQVHALAEKLGGQGRYLPVAKEDEIDFLRRAVCRDFDGGNCTALALKHGVSMERIEQVVNSKTFSKRQGNYRQAVEWSASQGFDFAYLETFFPAGWIEAWNDFACVFYAALINDDEQAFSNELLAMAAIDQVFALAHQMGGKTFYISRGDRFKQSLVQDDIRRNFTGFNYRELASKHDLSETRVRQIIQRYVKPKRQQATTSLIHSTKTI